MAKDKRRADIARFTKIYREFGAPAGSAAEQAIWVIFARHGTKEGAGRALKALWRRFVDINEFRVANATEIASLINRNVKNDAIAVAEDARGFLRRFHKDHHTTDFAVTQEMTVDQLRKYFMGAESHVRELALALFIHYCALEIAEEEAAALETEGKPKKRPEKDVTLAAERLRLLAAIATTGTVVAKTKQATASRTLARSWGYSTLPKGARKKVVTTKAPTPVPATTPAAAKAAAAAKKKAGGTARPKTTRASRTRSAAKKSSRR